jgi:hypothetical protein
MAFEGYELDGSNKVPGSLVSLIFEPGFISGYLLDTEGWFFMEPVGPLLMRNGLTPMGIGTCFPVNPPYEILYQEGDLNYSINLDPTSS